MTNETAPIALVTGASGGLGGALALELAKTGYHVIATGRAVKRLEALDDQGRAATGARLTLVPLDLSVGEAIDRLGGGIFERFGRLDALVHCAARAGPATPVAQIKPADFEAAMAVNALATQRLIRAMDPLLRLAAQAEAAFVTCAQARSADPFWAPYAASKAAMEAIVAAYAAERTRSSIRVRLIEPGPLRTQIRRDHMPGEPPERQIDPAIAARALAALLTQPRDENEPLLIAI